MKINQSQYRCQPVHIKRVIEHVYGTEDIPVVTTPMTDKWNEEIQDKADRCDAEEWMKLLGMIVWIMRTRLDIAVAVSRLCARTQKATTRDMNALRRLVAYLAFTEKCGTTFHASEIYEQQAEDISDRLL